MVVQEVGIPSGFAPDMSSVGNVAGIKRAEQRGRYLDIYFEKASSVIDIYFEKASSVIDIYFEKASSVRFKGGSGHLEHAANLEHP
jgi:hypothetical protein